MKITKIQKMKSGKYKIEFDKHEKITTYDEVILKNNLLFKKEIDVELSNQIEKDTKNYDGYYKALKYITTKMRSEKEMYTYLEKQSIPKKEQNKIIEKLKMNGLLNDKQFVSSFIADKVHLSNIGPNQIRRELENHNIDNDVVETELEKYEDSIFEEKLQKMMQKKVAMDHKHSKHQLQQKLMQDFINLGYDKEQISRALENMSYQDQDALEKEFQSLYRKLSKKYSAQQLKLQLKNKLYQKGFSLSDIQEKIEQIGGE